MNMKRIICLILAAITVLSLLASGIAILVSAADATAPSDTTTIGASENKELKNGDMIVIFILGAIVPCVIFLVMIVKTVWKKN